MRLPQRIAAALGEIVPVPTSFLLREQECQGATYHSPSPLNLHVVALDTDRMVYLCGTCRDNLDVYKELKAHFAGEIPWKVRREFGNRLRSIGEVAE